MSEDVATRPTPANYPADSSILASNTRGIPTELYGQPTTLTVVLMAGSNGDYAAYQGIGSVEFVMRHGAKLRFEEAKIHFPHGLEEERYRDR